MDNLNCHCVSDMRQDGAKVGEEVNLHDEDGEHVLTMHIADPKLWGKYKVGAEYDEAALEEDAKKYGYRAPEKDEE